MARTGAVEQLDMLVQHNLLHRPREAGSGRNRTSTRALQTVDDAALANVGKTWHKF